MSVFIDRRTALFTRRSERGIKKKKKKKVVKLSDIVVVSLLKLVSLCGKLSFSFMPQLLPRGGFGFIGRTLR